MCALPQDDPRSVDELFLVALCESDEDLAWDAKWALQRRGTQEILDRALRLCASTCGVERRAGADILGQLGGPDRTFPEECFRTLHEMLESEERGDVLQSILSALSHHMRSESVLPVSHFRGHADAEVRHAVVLVLSWHAEPLAVACLIELTRDPVAHVRDWATFGLGTLLDRDTPDVRECLIERLSDPDDDTRCEALVGLAQRRDVTVLPALSRELQSEFVCALAVEAAQLIADPRLYPDLVALREWWDVDKELLEDAITACSPVPMLVEMTDQAC